MYHIDGQTGTFAMQLIPKPGLKLPKVTVRRKTQKELSEAVTKLMQTNKYSGFRKL